MVVTDGWQNVESNAQDCRGRAKSNNWKFLERYYLLVYPVSIFSIYYSLTFLYAQNLHWNSFEIATNSDTFSRAGFESRFVHKWPITMFNFCFSLKKVRLSTFVVCVCVCIECIRACAGGKECGRSRTAHFHCSLFFKKLSLAVAGFTNLSEHSETQP